MEKSRLFEVFDALPKKDIKALKKFIISPFFNQRAHVTALFSFFVFCKFNKKALPKKEQAFNYVFPGQPYDDHKLRLSMSLLFKAIEKFLIWQQVADDEIVKELKLGKSYRKLGLPRHFTKSMATVESLQENLPHRHAEYYQYRYQFFMEQYLFNSEQNRMEGLQLEEMHENFDIAYLVSKLKQSCLLISHQTVYNKAYNFGMLEEVIQYVEKLGYLKIPAIAIYYYCYKALLMGGDYVHFSTFKTLIFKHQELFPKDEIRDLFLLAANYCIQQLNKGQHQFAQEGLDIYKEGLRSDILLLNNTLSHFTYRNIVAKAIVNKDFNWAEKFIQEYKSKLDPKHQKNSFSFNLAWLEYERKNYDEALSLLNKTNFTDLLLNLSAKTIAPKIYYEMEAFDLLYSHLEAMNTFLHRKKIIAYHKTNYLNTIKYTKKLLDTPLGNKGLRKQLKMIIQSENHIAEKKWLLRQLE